MLVSTYQRPHHLQRSLLSLSLQQGVHDKMEVVVTDDGSPDTSWPVVEAFAQTVSFPVRFTTHRHDGFRLARCRNEGIAVSTAPYLLITDADCVFPPDHIQCHLAHRREGRVVAGDCLRLDQSASESVTENTIRGGMYLNWISTPERRRLARKSLHGFWYHLFHMAMLPRLTGCNIGVWRSDLDKINGFDENYIGWGLEDRDLQLRLSRLGLRFKSILARTAPCHLWHAPAPTFARNNIGTKNLDYFRRKQVPTRCLVGLHERIVDSGDRLREENVRVDVAEERGDAAGPRVLQFPTYVQRKALRKTA